MIFFINKKYYKVKRYSKIYVLSWLGKRILLHFSSETLSQIANNPVPAPSPNLLLGRIIYPCKFKSVKNIIFNFFDLFTLLMKKLQKTFYFLLVTVKNSKWIAKYKVCIIQLDCVCQKYHRFYLIQQKDFSMRQIKSNQKLSIMS